MVFFQWCLLGGEKRNWKILYFYPLPIRLINGCKTSNLQLSFSHWHDKVCSSHSQTHECVSAFTLCSLIFCPVRQIGIYINFSSCMNSTCTHMPIEFWQCMQLCAYENHAHLHMYLVCTPQLNGPFKTNYITTYVILPVYTLFVHWWVCISGMRICGSVNNHIKLWLLQALEDVAPKFLLRVVYIYWNNIQFVLKEEATELPRKMFVCKCWNLLFWFLEERCQAKIRLEGSTCVFASHSTGIKNEGFLCVSKPRKIYLSKQFFLSILSEFLVHR